LSQTNSMSDDDGAFDRLAQLRLCFGETDPLLRPLTTRDRLRLCGLIGDVPGEGFRPIPWASRSRFSSAAIAW
jgi:hypothetical protein